MAFTNYIQQIKDSGGTTHDLVDSSASHYVKGTQTASTNVWTGALPDGVTAYYDGLSIDYFLPYAGTSTAATLNLGGKGAKPVYVGNGTSGVTTHFPVNSVIHMTYIVNSALNSGNGCWKVTSYYDTNTKNTAGATDTSSKIFLVGATSQAANPQTYSHDTAYVGTDGCLYSNNTKVLTAHQDISGKADKANPTITTDSGTSTVSLAANTKYKLTAGGGSIIFTTPPDNNTTYSAGTGLSLSSNTFAVKLGYTTSGNNRAVQADSNGNLYVVQKDDNTNNAVTQTATTTNANYEVLFSATADNTTRTEGAGKTSTLIYNPSTQALTAGKSVKINQWTWDGSTSGHLKLNYVG